MNNALSPSSAEESDLESTHLDNSDGEHGDDELDGIKEIIQPFPHTIPPPNHPTRTKSPAMLPEMLASLQRTLTPIVTIPETPERVGSESPDRRLSLSQASTTALGETAIQMREIAKELFKTELKWEQPSNILIVCKLTDRTIVKCCREMTEWLLRKFPDLTVYVDQRLLEASPNLYSQTAFGDLGSRLKYWTPEFCRQSQTSQLMDLIITAGGDGTLLHTGWLFQNVCPPIVAFRCRQSRKVGSTENGSMAVFLLESWKSVLQRVLGLDFVNNRVAEDAAMPMEDRFRTHHAIQVSRSRKSSFGSGRTNKSPDARSTSSDTLMRTSSNSTLSRRKSTLTELKSQQLQYRGMRVNFRQRFACTLYRKHTKKSDNSPSTPGGEPNLFAHLSDTPSLCWSYNDYLASQNTNDDGSTFHILNDLVLDRGPSPYLQQYELWGDGKLITTIQADGCIIATSNGSTAYSLSAGGSLVHPNLKPCILVTPVAAHELTLRPFILPDTMDLVLKIPDEGRTTEAWASFDGRYRVALHPGDSIHLVPSDYPFPVICNQDQSADFFDSLVRSLGWPRPTSNSFKKTRDSLASSSTEDIAKKMGRMMTISDDE